ncbi:vacuolar alkaline phosphatase [Mycoemilia scoparia]|uniref:Alkaline phosphatase n=1 Tax=Mycoemilia scoparia TaxID=417184 RepID=A0A9W8A0D2_9FUNG|nr:vacuolar alkaline phosphatase [Mycoemilia scoparia]
MSTIDSEKFLPNSENLDSNSPQVRLSRESIESINTAIHSESFDADVDTPPGERVSFASTTIAQKRMKRGFAFTIALLVVASLATRKSSKYNVILMISDGFGPASETMARNYFQRINKLPVHWQSPLDKILVGSSRTQSSDSLVTDSAAGATAFACALKSYNGAIGVTDEKKPCGTILEAAKKKGLLTGLVVTSRITHATPASFSAHVLDRGMEDLIAQYQVGNYSLGQTVDLMFGGGKCHFLPKGQEGSCRSDTINVWNMAKDNGYNVISTREEFDNLDIRGSNALPVLAALSPSHMSYDIDRDPRKEPSLAEMTSKALQILDTQTKDSDHGFFMMVEGSKIDLAAHGNDPAAHVREIIAYWDAIDAVKSYIDKHPNTLLVSVSDHETGGVTVGRQLDPFKYPEYRWNPEVLSAVQNSSSVIARYLSNYNKNDNDNNPSATKLDFIRNTVYPEWLGIKDATHEEVNTLAKETDTTLIEDIINESVATRAEIGFTTHGHTAVDVNLYAYGWGSKNLRGNHENTDIGSTIIDLLGLNLGEITDRIAGDNTKQDSPYDPYFMTLMTKGRQFE